LVVVCHSSPGRQIREWTELAESKGFIVLAPTVEARPGMLSAKPEKQMPLQREDERHILAAIRHASGGHRISQDRIFMRASGETATTALHTGLGNPEVFRAISLSDPRCSESCLTDVATAIEPHQPVQLLYNASHPLYGQHGKQCEDWLRGQGAFVRDHMISSARSKAAAGAVTFFEDCIRTQPWIHIRVAPSEKANPREFRFTVLCSFSPVSYRWQFGDGEESPLGEPLYSYARPGTYDVNVTVTPPKGDAHRRTKKLMVP